MDYIKINTPLTKEKIKSLKAGDNVLLSGTIYTARDAAHLRFQNAIIDKKELPFNIEGSVIYYAGPSPTPPGKIVGSMGPTTSCRMDKFTPMLLDMGLAATIGKGNRSKEVIEAIKRNESVYFAAIGGMAAIGSQCIKELEVIAYDDLASESVKKLVVEDLPLIVAVDCDGNDYYTIGKEEYLNYKKL